MNPLKDLSRQGTEMVTLFYSAKAAKTYGAYTGTIPDENGGEKTIIYTCPVSAAKKNSYLWDDKVELATCRACDVKEPKVCPHDQMASVLAKKQPSSPQLRI